METQRRQRTPGCCCKNIKMSGHLVKMVEGEVKPELGLQTERPKRKQEIDPDEVKEQGCGERVWESQRVEI